MSVANGRARRGHVWYRLALVALFLAWFAGAYRPGLGFTYVLHFDERRANTRVERMRDVPVYVHPGAGYDGEFYVQLAVDPLLRDPSIDRALDSAPFRARRILFSWTAWLLGLGRPAWIVVAYTVQNVVCWLLLAGWLHKRFPPDSVRHTALWTACAFTPGLLDSTRLALVDGPSLLLLALAVEALERGRPWLGAAGLGLASLARETNLLAGVALAPTAVGVRPVVRAAQGLVLLVLPAALWFDYLRSVYRSTVTQSLDQLSRPVEAYLQAWSRATAAALGSGWASVEGLWWLSLAAISFQAIHLLAGWRWRDPWWRVGVAFVALLLVIKGEIWLGAYLRVLLPLTLSFNLALPATRWFWPAFAFGNLGVALSLRLLVVGWS